MTATDAARPGSVEAGTGPDSAHEAWAIGLVSLGHFFSHFYWIALPTLLLMLKADFAVSFAAMGVAVTCYNLFGGLLQAPVGILVDRVGARGTLAAGLALNAICIAAIGFAQEFWLLLVLATLAGIGNSVFHPADYSILTASVRESRVGRAYSIHTFSGFLGSGIAPILLGAMAMAWGWRSTLIATGLIGLLVVVVFWLRWSHLVDEAGQRRAAEKSAGKATGATAPTAPSARGDLALLTRPSVLLMFAFFISINAASSGLVAFTQSGLIELHGLTQTAATLALNGLMLGMPVGVLASGVIVDRLRRPDWLIAAWMILAGLLSIVAAVPFGLDIAFVAIMTLVGVGFGGMLPPRDVLVRKLSPTGTTGKIFGFVFVGSAFGNGIGPTMSGWFMDNGLEAWVFVGMGAFFLLSMAIAMLARVAAAREESRRA